MKSTNGNLSLSVGRERDMPGKFRLIFPIIIPMAVLFCSKEISHLYLLIFFIYCLPFSLKLKEDYRKKCNSNSLNFTHVQIYSYIGNQTS